MGQHREVAGGDLSPVYNRMLIAHGEVDPCVGAPTITGVTATAAMRACASGGGVAHTGSMSYTGSMTGFEVEWQYAHGDPTVGGWSASSFNISQDVVNYEHPATTDVNQGGPSYAITDCRSQYRCRIVVATLHTACSDWTTSAASNNGIGNDGDLWDCP